MDSVRTLRVLTLLTSALATPLLIAMTVVSFQPNNGSHYYRYWRKPDFTTWCLGYIPLALTAGASVLSLIFHRKTGRLPNFKITLLDFFATLWYLGVLIPIWAIEVGHQRDAGMGLLAGYTTAPMIINMCVHTYLIVCNARFVWAWMSGLVSRTEHECPNCRSKFPATRSQVQEVSEGPERYSLLRGEDYLDDDAAAYTEARDSEEQVGLEGGADVEDKAQGAIKI